MLDPFRSIPDDVKYLFDGISITATVAALVQWLPSVAALASIIWMAIRIFETNTVQQLLGLRQAEAASDE